MKKSIVIGSNGYLGGHLSYFLESKGFNNHNYDLSERSKDKNYQSFDITKKKEFEKLDSNVDYIFLFAGLTGTSIGFKEYEKFVSVNEIGLLNLLSWMKETNCNARLVFPSTRLVYKGVKDKELIETDAKDPKTLYAINKLNAEYILEAYHNVYGLNYTVFRICVPYGNLFDNSYSYGTIGFFLNKALNQENIPLFGGGNYQRSFTHVEDICQTIIEASLIPKCNNEVYNIGGETYSLAEVAELFADKYNISVQSVEWPELDYKLESGDTIFSSKKLDQILGHEKSNSLQKWIANL
jgi:UDP-glucose 4-epimerase